MAKTETLLKRMAELEAETGVKRTIFAACPNSSAVIRASIRSAKRNNAPIYFAATLNQIDTDGGYTGMTAADFVKVCRMECEAINFTGDCIIAVDHGGPWLKDKQNVEKWETERAMNAVKESFEAAIAAGYDLIHVDPTVDINVPKGEVIDIHLVVRRTVELIQHCEEYRRANNYPEISYEVRFHPRSPSGGRTLRPIRKISAGRCPYRQCQLPPAGLFYPGDAGSRFGRCPYRTGFHSAGRSAWSCAG